MRSDLEAYWEARKPGKGNSLCLLFLFLLAVVIFTTAIYHLTPQQMPVPQQQLQKDQAELPQNEKTQQIAKPSNVQPVLPAEKPVAVVDIPKPAEVDASKSVEAANILEFTPIRAGEIHFTRIPREYWEHRLQTIKALGLNALSVYIFWNFHELRRGEFDFTTGEKDLVGFLQLSAKYGFKVLLRPGPYVCAEWDFGGLPARLLGIKDLQIRSNNALYEAEVLIYFTALAKVIRPYLQVNGGNIIMLQIENEYGSLPTSQNLHTAALLRMWQNLHISTNFYYEDSFQNREKHYWPGASIGLSGGHNPAQYTELKNSDSFKNRLVFGGEIYTGWLTEWGEPWQGLPIEKFKEHLQTLLSNNISFSLYMIHGGTNFALTAGANDFRHTGFLPHLTSYDYDAPINEQGSTNAKYNEAKQLLEKYGVKSSTALPEPIKTITIPPISLKLQANLLANLPAALPLPELTFFESDIMRMYHQGIVVYQTLLPSKRSYTLKILAHDHTLLFVDGEPAGSIRRRTYDDTTVNVECKRDAGCVLKVLVDAMGHVNYGDLQQPDRKGLLRFSIEGQNVNTAWKAYRIHLNTTELTTWDKTDAKQTYPKLLSGTFALSETGDTYFRLRPFGRGYVWVNGKLLGRYWNIGPEFTLFCPGVWMKKGENTIHVMQMEATGATSIDSGTTLNY